MFDGITRRVVSIWFPRLASDRVLRARPVDAPFALTLRQANTERLYCLNERASAMGLYRGMPFADARAFCPDLLSAPAHPARDARFLSTLRRWATRYCPWVGLEGEDGLVLDITGSAHLFGGEAAMLDDMRARLDRAGLAARLGLAPTRGAAWALWEPWQPSGRAYALTRTLYKHAHGTAVVFEETNHDLGLRLRSELTTCEDYGLLRLSQLAVLGDRPVEVRLLDGWHQLQPPGLNTRLMA